MLTASVRFRPGWKLTLFTLLLLPLLLSLGFWQLAREKEKLALQAVYEERQAQDPLTLAAARAEADPQYLPVALRGRYDNAHTFLLDNRVHQGRVGYEAISPFVTTEGTTVLINRGWIPAGPDRNEPPAPPPIMGEVALFAQVYVPPGETLMLGEEEPFSGWPRVRQSIDSAAMYAELGLAPGADTFAYTLRLADSQPGVLVRDWPVVSTEPEKHCAYAVQWFTMATVLLGLFFYAGLRGGREAGERGKS